MIRIFGTMTDPSGTPVPGAIIELRAISSTDEVMLGSTVTHKCDQQGQYDFQLAIGDYDAYAQNDRCGDMDYIGTARVSAISVDGNLHSVLVDGGIIITPPMLENALAAAQRAEAAAAGAAANKEGTDRDAEATRRDAESTASNAQQAAQSASTATSAKESIMNDAQDVRNLATQVSAQASTVSIQHGEVLAQAERVSTQASTVVTKHAEVVAKADQVSGNTKTVLESTSMAIAAADTATQKAVLAAGHEAVSLDAAIRAEHAASAAVGAILDGGECDLSGGVYPEPLTVVGEKYSTIWYVAVAGVVGGISFDVGDMLRYTTARDGYYFKVDTKDEVYSVNNEKGAVTITPEKIGAEKTGVADQCVNQHAEKTGAHQISGVQGLQEALSNKYSPDNKPTAADVGADPAGTASGVGESLDLKLATTNLALAESQSKIAELERYPKVIPINSILAVTDSNYTISEGECSALEFKTHYEVNGIVRLTSGASTSTSITPIKTKTPGNVKVHFSIANIGHDIGYNEAFVMFNPAGANIKFVRKETTPATWVMFNFRIIKE